MFLPSRRFVIGAFAISLIAGLIGIAVYRADANDPRLVFDGGAGEGLQTHRPYGTFYLGSICLSRAGKVTIVKIEPVKSQGGAEFTDFSTFPFEQLGNRSGADTKRLRDLPQFEGLRTVSEKCRKGKFDHTSLAVEIHNPGTGDAYGRGLKITYESGGRLRSIVADFDIGLCPSHDSNCP